MPGGSWDDEIGLVDWNSCALRLLWSTAVIGDVVMTVVPVESRILTVIGPIGSPLPSSATTVSTYGLPPVGPAEVMLMFGWSLAAAGTLTSANSVARAPITALMVRRIRDKAIPGEDHEAAEVLRH